MITTLIILGVILLLSELLRPKDPRREALKKVMKEYDEALLDLDDENPYRISNDDRANGSQP